MRKIKGFSKTLAYSFEPYGASDRWPICGEDVLRLPMRETDLQEVLIQQAEMQQTEQQEAEM